MSYKTLDRLSWKSRFPSPLLHKTFIAILRWHFQGESAPDIQILLSKQVKKIWEIVTDKYLPVNIKFISLLITFATIKTTSSSSWDFSGYTYNVMRIYNGYTMKITCNLIYLNWGRYLMQLRRNRNFSFGENWDQIYCTNSRSEAIKKDSHRPEPLLGPILGPSTFTTFKKLTEKDSCPSRYTVETSKKKSKVPFELI